MQGFIKMPPRKLSSIAQTKLQNRNKSTMMLISNETADNALAKRPSIKTRKFTVNKPSDNDSLFDAILNNNYKKVLMIQEKNEKLLHKVSGGVSNNTLPTKKTRHRQRKLNSPL